MMCTGEAQDSYPASDMEDIKDKIREHHYGDMLILKCCLNTGDVSDIIGPNQAERRY